MSLHLSGLTSILGKSPVSARLAMLRKSSFAKNAITLTVGTVVAQVLPFMFYPVFGRIFTPAEFGLLATISSIVPIIAIIASGMYESGILVAPSNKEAANLVGMILIRSALLSLICWGILEVFKSPLITRFNEPELGRWLFVVPVGAFATVLYNCFNEWCVRNKYFIRLSWNKIVNTSGIALAKLGIGLLKGFGNGLIVGDLLGRVVSSIFIVSTALKHDKHSFANISIRYFKPLAVKYREFPRFTMPDQLLSNIGGAIPVFLIGAYFSSTDLGHFSIAATVLTVPISVVSAAIKDVFRQRANEEYNSTGNCRPSYIKLLKMVTLVGVIGFGILYFFLPQLFSILLGPQWKLAGVYSQVMAPMFLLSFISMSLGGVLIIAQKMKISLYWQVYYVTTTLAALLIGIFVFEDFISMLYCFTIARCSAYLLYMAYSFRYAKADITPIQ